MHSEQSQELAGSRGESAPVRRSRTKVGDERTSSAPSSTSDWGEWTTHVYTERGRVCIPHLMQVLCKLTPVRTVQM